ncbi:MAG: peptidylprolyl isomerase [Gammaproteobacteria bacterium]|nr:peptidylprolyl isomerase [Gammaproteobacteria bacterium]
MSIARFEQQQRRELISEQIQSAFVDSAFVSERELDRAVALLEQERIAEYAVLPADDPDLEITVDDGQIGEYYESNRDAFVAPAQVRVEYLVLSLDEVAASITVDEDEIRQYYESNSARFGRPAERRASHVLINIAADADEAEVEAARQRAEEIAEQARAGADFAQLAREHSDDVGSAANGGDLGVINRGSMVQPFEEAVFDMDEAGAVGDPVRTRFGFHVIKLTGYRAAEVAPLEQVRGEIEEELKRQRAESQYPEQAETFATVVYEQPDSLDPAADALDLEIRTSDWFSADEGEGIAVNDRFRTVAFSGRGARRRAQQRGLRDRRQHHRGPSAPRNPGKAAPWASTKFATRFAASSNVRRAPMRPGSGARPWCNRSAGGGRPGAAGAGRRTRFAALRGHARRRNRYPLPPAGARNLLPARAGSGRGDHRRDCYARGRLHRLPAARSGRRRSGERRRGEPRSGAQRPALAPRPRRSMAGFSRRCATRLT